MVPVPAGVKGISGGRKCFCKHIRPELQRVLDENQIQASTRLPLRGLLQPKRTLVLVVSFQEALSGGETAFDDNRDRVECRFYICCPHSAPPGGPALSIRLCLLHSRLFDPVMQLELNKRRGRGACRERRKPFWLAVPGKGQQGALCQMRWQGRGERPATQSTLKAKVPPGGFSGAKEPAALPAGHWGCACAAVKPVQRGCETLPRHSSARTPFTATLHRRE